MRRHRTTALTILCVLLTGLAATAVSAPARGAGRGAVPKLVFPLVAKTDLWDNYGDPRPNGRHAGNRHGEPVARARRRGRGRPGRVRAVQPGRLHALPLRAERDDVPLHPPEQRPHREERQPGRLRPRRHVRRSRTARRSPPGSRSPGSATRGTRTAIRTSTSRCIPTTERTSTRSSTSRPRASRSSRHAPARCSASPCAENCSSGGAGTATLEVERVRQYPGGRWLDVDPRAVETDRSAWHDGLPRAPSR